MGARDGAPRLGEVGDDVGAPNIGARDGAPDAEVEGGVRTRDGTRGRRGRGRGWLIYLTAHSLEQHVDYLHVPRLARLRESRRAIVQLLVRVRPPVQQQAHHLGVPLVRRRDEGGRPVRAPGDLCVGPMAK